MYTEDVDGHEYEGWGRAISPSSLTRILIKITTINNIYMYTFN